MIASVTYPTPPNASGIDATSLTALMGGVAPSISSSGGFDTATWPTVPGGGGLIELLLELREIEGDLAVKVRYGSAP